ncbi:hypothetical protein, partial [Massilia glaciei]
MNYEKKPQQFFGAGVLPPRSQVAIDIDIRPQSRPRAEIVPKALTKALSDLIFHQVGPLAVYAPKTRFQLHQVRLLMTPENMALVGDLAAMPRTIRNDV